LRSAISSRPLFQNLRIGAIADAAAKNWSTLYWKRTGQKPGPDADEANQGIGPEPERLKTWARIHAKGQTRANGIVLLYGAGQVWPHMLGEFRVRVSAEIFSRYLSARWKPVFAGAAPWRRLKYRR
jgi:hypothetical protein